MLSIEQLPAEHLVNCMQSASLLRNLLDATSAEENAMRAMYFT